MIVCWMALAFLRAVACERSLLLVRGPSTPSEMLHLTQSLGLSAWLPSDLLLVHAEISDFTRLEALISDSIGVIDVTFSSVGKELLAGLCDLAHTPHIVLGYAMHVHPHHWTYYVSGRKTDLAVALDSLITYFGWNKLNVARDGNAHLMGISNILEEQVDRAYEVLDFTLNSTTNIEGVVGKEMRRSGNRVNVLLTDPMTTQVIVTAQYHRSIGDAGFGNVMPLFTSLYTGNTEVPSLYTGNLVPVESGLGDIETLVEFYTYWLSSSIQLFADYTEPANMKQSLDWLFPQHVRQPSYTLVNLQAGKRVIVGSVYQDQVAITGPIIFLGNTTEVPKNEEMPLAISANFGGDDVFSQDSLAIYFYYGGLLAVEQINTWPNLLEHFHLELFNFTAGVTVWDYNFAYEHVYLVRDKLGLAVLSGSSSRVTMHLIDLLGSFGFNGPVVGSINTADVLSEREKFPKYIRTTLPDRYMTVVYLEMIRRFRWKRCGLFVSNETWGLGFRSVFAGLAQQQGISIVNKEELQILPTPIPTVDTLRNYSANFLDFINSKARLLILVVNSNAIFVLDYLYELGLRQGDVQVVANEWLILSHFATSDMEINRRRSELLRGAIQFAPVSFVGKIGNRVQETFTAKYKAQASAYSCLFYDSALAIAYALDLVINNGGDYMNSAVLMKSLRGSRFVGCSGTVTFDRETNDRSPMSYNILNAQFAESDSLVTNITTVGVYDPTSTVLFRLYSDLIWCDGTTTVPLDMRISTIGCPHEDRFDKKFAKGKYLLWGIFTVIAILVTILTAVIWRFIWNRPLQELQERREIEVNDVLVMIGIAVELLQYLSIGPDLTFISQDFRKYILVTTFNFELIEGSQNFRVMWMVVTGCVGLSVLMSFIVFLNVDYVLEKVPCCRFIGDISEMLLYFIGNWLFIPITSILLEVFICVRGVGASEDSLGFTDSYLHADCYERCWQGVHLVYVALSSVTLLIYLPTAVLYRPLWQEILFPLNIKALPAFLLLKSVLQIILVLISKTVKLANPLIHSFLFFFLLVVFLIFSLKFNCYGYKRPQLWHILSLLAILWSTALSLIHTLSDFSQSFLQITILMSGWGGIILFGLIYQLLRIPSLLYKKKAVDTRPLFRFAFKPATSRIMASLIFSFQAVNHRSQIVPSASIANSVARRYELELEDFTNGGGLRSSRQHS